LKRKITEKPILILTNFNKPFQVKCDAIGAVLSQEDKSVAYFSEKLNESKKKYSSYGKEFYAVVQSLKKWRHYLMSKEFIIYSDCYTPRNSPRLYISDARQHYKLNKKLDKLVDE